MKDIIEKLNKTNKEFEEKEKVARESRNTILMNSLAKLNHTTDKLGSHIVYKCTNKVNGFAYIGGTQKEFQQRIWEHESDCKRKKSAHTFQKAMLEFGWSNWTWEILAKTETKAQCDYLEAYYIKIYHTWVEDSKCKGYNETFDGQQNRDTTKAVAAKKAKRNKIA